MSPHPIEARENSVVDTGYLYPAHSSYFPIKLCIVGKLRKIKFIKCYAFNIVCVEFFLWALSCVVGEKERESVGERERKNGATPTLELFKHMSPLPSINSPTLPLDP